MKKENEESSIRDTESRKLILSRAEKYSHSLCGYNIQRKPCMH
jgi:hypothetical protein